MPKNVPPELEDKFKSCKDKLLGDGHSEDSAYAICYTSIVEGKSLKDATQLWLKDKLSEMKQGARHSAGDMNMIQTIHDHATTLGADCSGAGKSMAVKMIGGMQQMTGMDYAIHEGWDIQQCCSVISQLSAMCQDECNEGEMDEAMQLCNIMMSLMDHCKGECQEMMDAMRVGDNTYKSTQTTAPVYAEVRNSPDLHMSYVKSLGVPDATKGISVKYIAQNQIKGYTFLWGSPSLTDVEIEYFTHDTDFWDAKLGKSARPLTWDHAQDKDFKASPIIGEIVDFGDDDIGRWYVAKLDTAHRYRAAIDELIKKGALGTSSDSAPQYVQRVKTGKATWLKEWPWFASALTDTPAEPRMIGSLEVLKSLGVQLPDTRVAWEWNKQRLTLSKLI